MSTPEGRVSAEHRVCKCFRLQQCRFDQLIAAPNREPDVIETFLDRARIDVEWTLDPTVWRTAALAFRGYAQRRRAQAGDSGPRRILADFVIGAHALNAGASLMTLDQRLYRVAFPALNLIVPAT